MRDKGKLKTLGLKIFYFEESSIQEAVKSHMSRTSKLALLIHNIPSTPDTSWWLFDEVHSALRKFAGSYSLDPVILGVQWHCHSLREKDKSIGLSNNMTTPST